MTRETAAATAAIVVLAALASGQVSVELKVKERVPVSGQSASVMIAPFGCDSDGNVFFQPYAGRSLSPEIVRVSADGKKVTHFSVGSVTGFEHSPVAAYAISPDSDVYLASFKPPGDNYILRFDKDGQYRSATKLDDLEKGGVTQLALFGPTRYFVAGSQVVRDAKPATPFGAIFNDSGKMIAAVKFPRDPQQGSRAISPDSARADKSSPQELEKSLGALGLSLAESGGDGNVYFTRHGPGGPAYVVSATGEVLKAIHLDDPTEAGFELMAAKAAGGMLAIMYEGHAPAGETSAVKLLVYDVRTGKSVANYFHQNFEIGNALACYSPDDTFTFISSDEGGKMILVRASAR